MRQSAANTAIDLYCERTSAAFWAEPVNALSNLAFVTAALALVLLLRSGGLFFIAALAVLHCRAGRRGPNLLWQACAVFVVALACRSLDTWLCPSWPLGKYFL